MGFVICRREDGKFVTPPGMQHSYTKRLQEARLFPTRVAADAEKCDNEYVAAVESLFVLFVTEE